MAHEVFPVGSEVASDGGDDRIIVAWVDDRVSKHYQCRSTTPVGSFGLPLDELEEKDKESECSGGSYFEAFVPHQGSSHGFSTLNWLCCSSTPNYTWIEKLVWPIMN